MISSWLAPVLNLLGLGAGSPSVPPAPVANFTGTPLTGYAPLTVNYTDSSTGDITSRSFMPGDGSGPYTSVPATHTYLFAGTYSPSLEVTGPGGSNTLTRTDYITVYPPLTGTICGYFAVQNQVTGEFSLQDQVDGSFALQDTITGSFAIKKCGC